MLTVWSDTDVSCWMWCCKHWLVQSHKAESVSSLAGSARVVVLWRTDINMHLPPGCTVTELRRAGDGR